MPISLATLLTPETKAAIYQTAIGIAESLGLPVSTWQAGDPTRSQLHIEAEFLARLEQVAVGYIASGFLDHAADLAKADPASSSAGVWLKVLADQVFGVTVPPASSATTTVVLSNLGGGLYDDIQAGDLTFKNSASGKTYRNTTGGTLASGPGTTLSVTVVADEPGSASSAAPGEIDDLVTTLLGVTCSNPTAAVGVDEQAPDTTVLQCRDKLGSLSPNGPKEAYSYVARNPALTGTNGVSRVRVYGDSDTGDVVVYLAGPSGGVSPADRTLVEEAILTWATPLCITPSVYAATNVTVPVTYQLWVYKSVNKSASEVESAVATALATMISNRPIGGDIIPPSTGAIYNTMIESTIRDTFPQVFRVIVTTPIGDAALTAGQVAVLGTVTATINLVTDG